MNRLRDRLLAFGIGSYCDDRVGCRGKASEYAVSCSGKCMLRRRFGRGGLVLTLNIASQKKSRVLSVRGEEVVILLRARTGCL